MQDASSQLREFMRRKGLNQSQLARLATVSQSTVSRALSAAWRRGAAQQRLFIYADIAPPSSPRMRGGRRQVIRAFDQIWDGSDDHATAVAKVIDALSGLRPADRKEEESK
jgi:hypothetical protein